MKSYFRPFALLVAILVAECVFTAQGSFFLTVGPTVLAASSPQGETITIPGPLRSFLRMAAISQKAAPEDVLPLFAHNIYEQGYVAGSPTESLRLLARYVHQARDLQVLAGAANIIQVPTCEAAGPLIQILGYRLTQQCGQMGITLATANAEEAFLTIDSGFPLTDLEESLQKGVPFIYPYAPSHLPVLFKESDWIVLSTGPKARYSNLVDTLINTPAIARLYWALNKTNTETRLALQKSPGLARLLPLAPALDFYGSQVSIHAGRVSVPGGGAAEPVWKDLVGSSPASSGDFVLKLLSKDLGWLAAYFDVLARLNHAQQEHFTQAPRLAHLYEDFRLTNTKPGATYGVFRRAPQLLVLDTRMNWEPNGDPHVPGDLEIWKQILLDKTKTKSVHEWNERFHSWDHPEQLLEAVTAFSRTDTDTGPVQMYLMMCQIDSGRAPGRRLSSATVSLLAKRFAQFKDWYLLFSEFPELNDESISRFIRQADAVDKIANPLVRGNALGIFQANLGLWQILARQHEMTDSDLNQSLQKLLDPFSNITNSTQLFDAGRASFQSLLAASGKPRGSPDDLIELLAGPKQTSPEGQRIQQDLAGRIRAVLDDQRLVSLDTLFALSDGLDAMAKGGAKDSSLTALAGELREFELPKPIFTNSEKITWAPMNYVGHHAELQVKTDLTKVIAGPSTKSQLDAGRGRLTPFFRDTLVGLNYAYYEPPGSQMLHNNPLFVRAHDFAGISIVGFGSAWSPPQLLGAGVSAGGGAYLMGSLVGLPRALAQTEQDFISPENIQALVWKELFPDLLEDAIMARWWTVSQNELHAAALYQRAGEELLARAVTDETVRAQVLTILADRISPQRLEQIEASLLRSEDLAAALPFMLPADTFFLAAEFRRRSPQQAADTGAANNQLEELSRKFPEEASPERLSRDFGVPHPALGFTYTRELLNVKPFPFVGSYSYRLFGESWESGNLYWARLADDMGYSPVMLNRLVPDLTRRMVGKIFATELEDWPAILRAMVETGDEVRRRKSTTEPVVSDNRATGDTALDGKEK